MLYFEFEVFTPRHIRLWSACRDGVYLCKKRNRPKIADRVHVIYKIEKEKGHEYLETKSKIYCRRDLDWNVLVLDIKLRAGCWIKNASGLIEEMHENGTFSYFAVKTCWKEQTRTFTVFDESHFSKICILYMWQWNA